MAVVWLTICLARPENFVNAADALRAVGHCRDGLRPSDAVDVCDAANVRCVDDFRGNLSVMSLRGAEHHLLAARNACRKSQHQDRGEKRCLSAWNVKANALDWHGPLVTADAFCRLHLNGNWTLRGVEGRDILGGSGNCPFHVFRHLCSGRLAFRLADFNLRNLCPVKFPGISAQCFIALRFNSGDNLSHTFLYGRVVGDIALRQSIPGVA